jgi:hypothetical protein
MSISSTPRVTCRGDDSANPAVKSEQKNPCYLYNEWTVDTAAAAHCLDEYDPMQLVVRLPWTADTESDIRCLCLEEGPVEMSLEISRQRP